MPWFYDCMDSTGLHERTARKGSLHARAALPSTYSAEAIVKLNAADRRRRTRWKTPLGSIGRPVSKAGAGLELARLC